MKLKLHLADCLYAVFLLIIQPCLAAEDDVDNLKPFAGKHVVLQLSDTASEAAVLDVANNLIRSYGGPDLIDIEIVTFGKGVSLLFAESPFQTRITSLVDNGVRFYICGNTLESLERTSGKRADVNPVAIQVQAGVAHLIDRAGQGYIVIRP